MKFENIKVGDTVFLEKVVSYGWRNSKTFTIPFKVERVTATQFIVDGRKFKKENGREIGEYNFAKLQDIDQSAEMKAFEEFLQVLWKTQKLLESVKITVETPLKKILALKKAIEEFKNNN